MVTRNITLFASKLGSRKVLPSSVLAGHQISNMLFVECIILFLASGASAIFRGYMTNSVPTAVALGGAVVAAVEENEAQQKLNMERKIYTGNETLSGNSKLENVISNGKLNEGRGKKYRKKDKFLKHLYPLLIGGVLAKTIVFPLVLKALIALSTSSFVMAKVALAASALIVLKWLLADTGNDRTRFEIVHLPSKNHGSSDWSDMAWSGSNYVDIKTTPKQRLKYIPLSASTSGLQNAFFINKGVDASDYRYSYDNSYDGKPFL